MTWDPARYLRFEEQRSRPAFDLLARLPDLRPATVWDLGCGAGAVTRALAARWPEARVFGLDSSPEMLARASGFDARVTWLQGAIEDWSPSEPADVIFANASLHWVADHDSLFPALAASLAPGGVLAVQMPRNFGEPSHTVLSEVARRERWAPLVGHRAGRVPVDEPRAYLGRLAGSCRMVDVWETIYHHVLEGEDAVARWVEGTACRPYLDDLGAEGAEFLAEYATALRPHYPADPDGTTVLPFRRLFLIAVR